MSRYNPNRKYSFPCKRCSQRKHCMSLASTFLQKKRRKKSASTERDWNLPNLNSRRWSPAGQTRFGRAPGLWIASPHRLWNPLRGKAPLRRGHWRGDFGRSAYAPPLLSLQYAGVRLWLCVEGIVFFSAQFTSTCGLVPPLGDYPGFIVSSGAETRVSLLEG